MGEIGPIYLLVAMFAVAAVRSVNMGLIALALAYGVGTLSAGMTGKEVASIFPGDLFITMLGVTYLFAVAEHNGAVAWMIERITRLVPARIMPVALFGVACAMTSVGALAPAAIAMLLPFAMGFARHNGMRAVLMGLITIHGAQAGGFSPLGVFGVITRGVIVGAELPWFALPVFLANFIANAGAATIAYRFLGGSKTVPTAVQDEAVPVAPTTSPLTYLTLLGFFALGISSFVFETDVGFTAIAIGVCLSLAEKTAGRQILQRLPWPEIVLITGVSTYVGLLQKLGIIASIGTHVAELQVAAVAVLLLLFIAALVSAFASSTAVLGSLIPLAIPLLATQPPAAAILIVAGLTVATTIVDVSPFSTAGALVVGNAHEDERQQVFRTLAIYGGAVTLLSPVILWCAYLLLT